MRDVPLAGASIEVRGAVWLEHTDDALIPRRYQPAAGDRFVDDFMRAAARQSTGIRLAFRTAARRVELTVGATRLTDSMEAAPPVAVYDLCAGGEVVDSATSIAGTRLVRGNGTITHIDPGTDDVLAFTLDGVERDYELWLPYTDEVALRSFRADAAVQRPAAAATLPRWLHHGSSISHGYVASRTTRTWPVRAAAACDVELLNLAYSGNAVLDQSTARTIRDTPADVISLKLGINIVNGDSMRLRVFRSAVHGFLDTIRDGHADTPILVVSPIFCGPVEAAPGPTTPEFRDGAAWHGIAGSPEDLARGKLSLEIIRTELASIVAARAKSDTHLGYLDGLTLYGRADNARLPMPDNLHPADDVNALIAERFASAVVGSSGWLALTPTA